MNTYSIKPMPYGAKLRKLYLGQFYLSDACRDESASLIDAGSMTKERQLIDYIDTHGEWLD